MIVLDRSVDWVTPMCTQLTYEGLIDEIMGIKNCQSPRLASSVVHMALTRLRFSSCRGLARSAGYKSSANACHHSSCDDWSDNVDASAKEEEAPAQLDRQGLRRTSRSQLLGRRDQAEQDRKADRGGVRSGQSPQFLEVYRCRGLTHSASSYRFSLQGKAGKDIAQIKDFVGKLGSLQSEHQALKLRESAYRVRPGPCLAADYRFILLQILA